MGLHGWPGIERLGLRVGGAGWRRTTAALILHLGTALDLACSSKVLARQGSRCAASRCVKLARRTLTPLTTTLPGGCPLHPSSLSAAHPASPAPSTLSLPGRLATGFAHTMPSPPPPRTHPRWQLAAHTMPTMRGCSSFPSSTGGLTAGASSARPAACRTRCTPHLAGWGLLLRRSTTQAPSEQRSSAPRHTHSRAACKLKQKPCGCLPPPPFCSLARHHQI